MKITAKNPFDGVEIIELDVEAMQKGYELMGELQRIENENRDLQSDKHVYDTLFNKKGCE